jgi:hypothetical protein
MTRDMELVRALLPKLEAMQIRRGGIVSIAPDDDEIAIPGYDVAQISYHLALIRDAGFIDNGGVRPMDGIGFRSLTWAGHDFLDAVRDPEIWRRTKVGAKKVGSWSIELLFGLAKEYTKQIAKEKLGFDLG